MTFRVLAWDTPAGRRYLADGGAVVDCPRRAYRLPEGYDLWRLETKLRLLTGSRLAPPGVRVVTCRVDVVS